ncbi:MAG: Phytanoyl-CoA dioxygenase domain containing 1 [Actinomycetia bacterium]|nr:Phytanoyl-CoA dioxygenase domain containing 1 [Actinomycetes bacterium]
MLTPEQRVRWERDGFLALPGFVDAAACDELRAHAEELIAGFDPDENRSVFSTHEQTRTSDDWFLTSGDKLRFFVEAEDHRVVNKIGHAMHDLDPTFDRFSRNPDLAAVAHDVGLAEPLLLQSMYILKAPHVGGEVTLHTDHTFLWTDPQTATGFWFALEDATLENGCLWALPGGHRLPVRQRFRRDGAGGTTFEVLDAEPYPTAGEVPLEATKGTLIVLHGLLPHRSDANRSARSRAAYTLHCIDAAAAYPADNWLQRSADLPLRGFGREARPAPA